MSIEITVEVATHCLCPSLEEFERWAKAALHTRRDQGSLAIKIVDVDEMTELNHHYRNQNKPTNVLSFPCHLPAHLKTDILGDIALCAPVVEKEALEQGKP